MKPSLHSRLRPRRWPARFVLVLALFILAAASTLNLAPTQAAPPAQKPDEGQALYESKCFGCHTIGGGPTVGPDLKGVTQRREPAWLLRWIQVPDQMLAQGDPIATQLLRENKNIQMPNLGITASQADSLVAYFGGIDAGTIAAPTPAAAPASTLPPGNLARGLDLFTGSARFQNGGSPCIACHSIGGLGAPGGGTLGPDLTPAFTKFGGEAGMANFFATLPFPTMNAVWTAHPLALQEQADLVAFLQQAPASGPPVDAMGALALVGALAVVGTVLLLALTQFYWRRRLTGVRGPMILRTPKV